MALIQYELHPRIDTADVPGAEIEQAVIAALYAAYAQKQRLDTAHLTSEIKQTRPLSVVLNERISELRQWAAGRTVSCD